MRKRLRKKLYVKEFTEVFYRIEFWAPKGVTEEERHTLLFDFLDEAIEAHKLICTGMAGDDAIAWVFITKGDRHRTIVQEDVDAIRQWLEARPGITGIMIGKDDL